jgi:hypothetical protein
MMLGIVRNAVEAAIADKQAQKWARQLATTLERASMRLRLAHGGNPLWGAGAHRETRAAPKESSVMKSVKKAVELFAHGKHYTDQIQEMSGIGDRQAEWLQAKFERLRIARKKTYAITIGETELKGDIHYPDDADISEEEYD